MLIDVIGGSGFIGTRLIGRLRKSLPSASCSILDKNQSAAFPEVRKSCDVRSQDQLRDAISPGAVIINLAAEHRDDVRPTSLYFDVNVEGARNICLVAREKRVEKIVFTSTVAVYGFAKPGTDETGVLAPFNDYGRSKAEAEDIYAEWQREDPSNRVLVVLRPTVVFGERNRGNVYNLMRQVGAKRFVMIGPGTNRKSVAYVENVAAFIEYSMGLPAGHHVFNYVDKPDFLMNDLVVRIKRSFGAEPKIRFRVSFLVGYLIGKAFDVAALLTGRKFAISSIRVRKFCADSVYASAAHKTAFTAPVSLEKAIDDTIKADFFATPDDSALFYSE